MKLSCNSCGTFWDIGNISTNESNKNYYMEGGEIVKCLSCQDNETTYYFEASEDNAGSPSIVDDENNWEELLNL